MNVAQVTLRFDAPGGVETTVREVSKGLRALGVSVEVYASDLYDEGRWERRSDFADRVEGIPVHRFRVYKRLVPGLTMPLMVGLVDALGASDPEIIHAHSHRYGHVLESVLVGRARRRPIVISTHYHPADRREPPGKRALLRLQDHVFGLTAYRSADAIVVETALEARLVAEFAPRERIHIIPPGINLDDWKADRPQPRPAGLPERYILYAGRLAANKGLPNLIRAFARLPSSERIPLVLMGSDWGEQATLEALARELGVASELRWMGHMADPRAYREVFRHATLFVLPSEWEAYGMVLLEAMAGGLPIVASRVGGIPEVLEQGRAGRLVPYGDPAALAEALLGLLRDDAEARRLGALGKVLVEHHDWSRAVASHRALYEELAGRRGG